MTKAKGKTLPLISAGCCSVEALVSVDERGQMVLPKDLRDRAGIKAGDKLAVITWQKDGGVCCITLMKAEGLAEMAKTFLQPLMQGISGK